jgi:hypothetical protein
MKQYDNRFVVAVLICLKEIIFHISSYLNFCVCKYTNFLFSTVGRNIAANGWRYETLGSSELRTYQPIRTLPASDALALPLKPQCFMTAC